MNDIKINKYELEKLNIKFREKKVNTIANPDKFAIVNKYLKLDFNDKCHVHDGEALKFYEYLLIK